MQKMLVLAMMVMLCLLTGCSKNKTARSVQPVPMPPGSADTNQGYYGKTSPTMAPVNGSTQANNDPKSVEDVQSQTSYVASPESPYIELPAVSEPGTMQPMNTTTTEPIKQPANPLANEAPSTYTFSNEPAPSTPTPTHIQPSTPAVPVPATASAMHVVAKGDTLWRIAKQYYGDGKRWGDIAKANNISNPERIYVGMKLTIPR